MTTKVALLKLVSIVAFAALAGIVATVAAGVVSLEQASPEGDAMKADRTQRTVLVTGANRGIGLALAREFQKRGYMVIGTARKPDEAKELSALGARVLPLDVSDGRSVAALAVALRDLPIDMLINNAGISGPEGADTLAALDVEAVARTLAVNTIGPMRVTQALLPNLKKGSRKVIATISSGLGSIEDNATGGFHGYRESKAAANMFMRSMAAELRTDGFICLAISPGWVRTDMGGAGAPLSPEESATGLARVLERATTKESGSFIAHDGSTVRW